MNAIDHLTANKNNIRHYNEVKQVIDELEEHRTDFGKIQLYCTENLLNDIKYDNAILNDAKYELEQNKWVYSKGFDWRKCAEIRSELIDIVKKDETYTVFYHFLLSDYVHLDEKYSYTIAEYERFARQAERAITFNRSDLVEKLKTIESYNEKLSYLINQKANYLNESHKWQDLPEYDFSKLCENEINRLQQLRKIDNLLSKIDDTIPAYIDLPDNLLDKLQQQGFIEDATKRPLKWLRKKVLLAYLAEVTNDKLNLKNGEKRQIKPFEILFNVSGLTSAINDYKKIGTLPVGHKDIDRLF